jgi:hypothetical protein
MAIQRGQPGKGPSSEIHVGMAIDNDSQMMR